MTMSSSMTMSRAPSAEITAILDGERLRRKRRIGLTEFVRERVSKTL